jgi:hypothetical protein
VRIIYGKHFGSITAVFIPENQLFSIESKKSGDEFFIEFETLGKKYILTMITVPEEYWKDVMNILNNSIETYIEQSNTFDVLDFDWIFSISASNYLYHSGFSVTRGLETFLKTEEIIY